MKAALLLICALAAISAQVSQGGQQLDVHIIAHSHDDVGWLKTVDEYYTGFNQSRQEAGVQYIIDNVINLLLEDENRKFIYVEMAFFERWWREQTQNKKNIVKKLVAQGRLEFINGGWCMNDEATTHYSGVIDQMTLGHNFLLREFGVVPKIAWHVDPFGHASTQATLFSKMGFEGFFFGRIDYQEQQWRNDTREMEFMWRNSKSFGQETDMWSHVLYASYSYLTGFAWEYGDEPVQDDPRLFNYNVKRRADVFAELVRERAATIKHNNVLIPFGEDFQFEKGNVNFKNMDKLIKYINDHQEYNMKLRYSTPSIYLQSVKNAKVTWSVREGDFFPYADKAHAYWTGFYSSRPTLKGYAREMNALAHIADKLFAFSEFQAGTVDYDKNVDRIAYMDDAYAIVQHHDAIAGTETQHVAEDYALRLSIGQEHVSLVIDEVVSKLAKVNSGKSSGNFVFCPLLNESICSYTENLTSPIFVTVYNPIAWNREHFVRFPVTRKDIIVTGPDGDVLDADLFPNVDFPAKLDLIFTVKISPSGFSTFTIAPGITNKTRFVAGEQMASGNFKSTDFEMDFSAENGGLSSVTDVASGKKVNVKLDYFWYKSSIGDVQSSQVSGAYIFRPNGVSGISVNKPTLTYYNGTLVQEVRQTFGSWLSHSIRLWRHTNGLEIVTTVDTIDVSDGLGKEVTARFSSDVKSGDTWYTDSMGMEMIERKRNVRSWPYNISEPIAWNYVPVNEVAHIQDDNAALAFVMDRSRGCSSLASGQLEFMLQRRILKDDRRGMGEALNSKERVRGSIWVLLDPPTKSASNRRPTGLLISNQPLPMFSYSKSNVKVWAPGTLLPHNVHVLNVRNVPEGVLVRLHHLFEKDEDSQLSAPVNVDLSKVLSPMNIMSVSEMSLSGNNVLNATLGSNVITLSPMETRTFLVKRG